MAEDEKKDEETDPDETKEEVEYPGGEKEIVSSRESGRIRDFGNLDMKIDARRELHWYLWVSGKKLTKIREITGWGRWVIWQDLKYIRENLSLTPKATEDVRQETLMSLRLDRARALEELDESEDPKARVKFLALAATIDLKILERYTQPLKTGEKEIMDASEKAQAVLDFMVQKFGPESLDGFEAFYTNRKLSIESRKKTGQ